MSDYIETNIGDIPIEDYKEIVAIQNGFESYEEMEEEGYILVDEMYKFMEGSN